MRAPETTSWHSASWQTRPVQQQPVYSDLKSLERVVAQISRLPPIVVSWEVEALRARLAAAQRGEAFLLQGGDCAEAFADCESDTSDQVRVRRALEALEMIQQPAALGLLESLSRGAADAFPTPEARAALERMGRHRLGRR